MVSGTGISPNTKVGSVDAFNQQVTLSAPATFLQNNSLQFRTIQIELGDVSGIVARHDCSW